MSSAKKEEHLRKLTEAQRIKVLAYSSMIGGDATLVKVDATAGAIQDMSSNPNEQNYNIFVNETKDATPPELLHVKLDFNTGELELTQNRLVAANASVAAADSSREGLEVLLAEQAGAYEKKLVAREAGVHALQLRLVSALGVVQLRLCECM